MKSKAKEYLGEQARLGEVPYGTAVQMNPQVQQALALPTSLAVVGLRKGTRIVLPYVRGVIDYSQYAVPRSNLSPVKRLTGTMGKKLHSLYQDQTKKNFTEAMMKNHVTIGADPEFFLVDSKTGKRVNAWEVLPSKREPVEFRDSPGTPRMYWDGLQAEFAFGSGHGKCMEGFTSRLGVAISKLLETVNAKRPGTTLAAQPVMEVPVEELLSYKEDYVRFGCEPSRNAYGHPWVEVKNCFEETLRPAGGHIHFGLEAGGMKNDEETVLRCVKAIDAIGGVATVGIFEGIDHPGRRKNYGRAGEYRKTPYGFEYRVLSNAWLYNPTMGFLVMDLIRLGVWMVAAGVEGVWDSTEMEVQEAINTTNPNLSRGIVLRNEETLREMLARVLGYTENAVLKTMNIIYNSHKVAKLDMTHVAQNWTGGDNSTKTWGRHCQNF
jgi:hypothetical protein